MNCMQEPSMHDGTACLEPRNSGTQEPSSPGTQEPRNPGAQEPIDSSIGIFRVPVLIFVLKPKCPVQKHPD